MMDDYVFLEDVGRKVGDWGAEIGRGRYMASAADRGRGRGFGGRGRGRGRSFGGGNIGKSKQDVFKQQLELRDIDVELLPDGMERKMFNKSMWDFKCVCSQLAVIDVFINTVLVQKEDGAFDHRVQVPCSCKPCGSILSAPRAHFCAPHP